MLLVLSQNICQNKKKLTVFDFDIILKRGKLAGKSMVQNLAFLTHSKLRRHRSSRYPFPSQLAHHHEYEFSCSDTPARVFPFPFPSSAANFFACAHAPRTADEFIIPGNLTSGSELLESPAVASFLKSPMIMDEYGFYYNGAASPALPGFGRTPLARQLRVTDSPFPVNDTEESCYVDKAAEEFIVNFYQHLRKQNSMAMGSIV